MAQDQLFFVGQKAFIEKDGQVLALINQAGKLDFPGGKIQEGEVNFSDSLRREVREEVGLEIEIGDAFHAWHFVLPSGHKHAGRIVYLVGYRCKYKSGEIALSDEHIRFEWVNRSDYQHLAQSGPHVEALEKYFKTR